MCQHAEHHSTFLESLIDFSQAVASPRLHQDFTLTYFTSNSFPLDFDFTAMPDKNKLNVPLNSPLTSKADKDNLDVRKHATTTTRRGRRDALIRHARVQPDYLDMVPDFRIVLACVAFCYFMCLRYLRHDDPCKEMITV